MAKLEGVKTLDMVNGEITKVAYGGAEYVKTDSPVQEGDLFLLTEWHEVICGETGAFYLTNRDHDGDIVIPTKYVGLATNVQKKGHGIAYRKVAAAINPSVEERVAKAEGEIESLKSDVAALKGAAEPKPERLKVGDYAKVIGDESGHYAELNEIVLVERDDRGRVPFLCKKLNGNNAGWFYGAELVRATDEEVAEAKRAAEFAKFKVGVKVRLKSGGGEFPLNGYENGKVYEISYAHLQRNRIGIIGGEITMGFATPDQLEILSEEEAAEYKKWAGIGREVGEYKEGDVVAYDDPEWFQNSGIGEVIELMDGTPCVLATNSRGSKVPIYVSTEQVKLVTPVEARFDR
nr:hypothetical protein [Bacillus subtilis]WEZ21211.1 hypothetical protein P5661_06430 [Bacillus subtilis]